MSEVLNEQDRYTIELINFHVISFTFGIFGIVANIVNLIVFLKQGFKHTVNIAFFGLALSDLCCLILLVWFCICTNPFLFASKVPWVSLDIAFLSASWPHVSFCRITSYITIYITVERYLSIAFPLKVKQMITTKRTTLIIIVIYFVNISALTPEYASSYLDWRYVLQANKTLIALILNNNRKNVEGVENVLHALLSMMSFIGVIISTAALVTKFKQSSQFRKEIAPTSAAQDSRGQKMKLVVLIACVLIVCYTPGTMLSLTTFIVGPEFNVFGKHVNICWATWSMAYSCQTINSSINIFLYYNMSSKYKRTLREILRIKLRI